MKKLLTMAAMAIVLCSCGTQNMQIFETHPVHNTNRQNIPFGVNYRYKYHSGDTVYNNATGITYKIDSPQRIQYAFGGYRKRPAPYPIYKATNIIKGGQDSCILENTLVKL